MIDPDLRRSMRPPRSRSLAALDSLRVHVERVERLARRHEEPIALEPSEAEAVGPWNVAGDGGDLARPAVDAIDVGRQLRRRHVALVVAEDSEGRVAEPDGPVRLADDVVRRVQRLALVAVGHDRDGAVVL